MKNLRTPLSMPWEFSTDDTVILHQNIKGRVNLPIGRNE